MTDKEDFFNKPCEKLSAACVDAFTELVYNPTEDYNLGLSTSWGESYLDMRPIIKAGETVTHLTLTESALQFDREDGDADCVSGDALSTIVSMQYLKDVDKDTPIGKSMLYVFDGNKFVATPSNLVGGDLSSITKQLQQLQTSVALLQTSNTNLLQRVTKLENTVNEYGRRISSLENRTEALEAVTAKPSYAPDNAVIAWGNINDTYNNDPLHKGIYTHNPTDNPTNNVIGDQRFA